MRLCFFAYATMKDVLQWAIDHYETRDQLVQKGIWKGELYHDSIFKENSRGWLWKALLLCDENNNCLLTDNFKGLDLNPVRLGASAYAGRWRQL